MVCLFSFNKKKNKLHAWIYLKASVTEKEYASYLTLKVARQSRKIAGTGHTVIVDLRYIQMNNQLQVRSAQRFFQRDTYSKPFKIFKDSNIVIHKISWGHLFQITVILFKEMILASSFVINYHFGYEKYLVQPVRHYHELP